MSLARKVAPIATSFLNLRALTNIDILRIFTTTYISKRFHFNIKLFFINSKYFKD